jgi:ParB-like chromosome segregation protein Spo0J|tara:strand:+ start:360 stop:953 length:594 start_codon:yes stop_codon:yes gene_type:complete
MQTDTVGISSVVPYARNPRRNEAAIAKVAASLQEFGWRQPIVVDEDMVVVAGHTRLEAARTLNMEEVPIHIARGLTPEQIKAYRLADNRVGQEAEWDEELLRLELGELESAGFDIDLTGFHPSEFVLDEIDYSLLEEETGVDGMLDGMASGVKKAIQIEFEPEHYEEAQALVKWWRDKKAYVGYMVLKFLKEEKEKA